MSGLLALDPSIRSTGAAIFWGSDLIAATRIKLPPTGSKAERCLCIARQVMVWCESMGGTTVQQLVFEWPQIYRTSKSKGDPNDLPALAGVGMAVAGLYAHRPLTLACYTPAEWTGQLPKETTAAGYASSPRTKFIMSNLTEEEQQILPPKSHDALDAVGIGLHHLGRLRRHRVLPGASE